MSASILDNTLQLRSYNEVTSSHKHEYYQWVFPLQGNLEIEIEQKGGNVHQQQAAFIAPNQNHCFESHGQNLFLVLDMIPTYQWAALTEPQSFWNLTPSIKNFLVFAHSYLPHNSTDLSANTFIRDIMLKLLSQHFISIYDPKVLVAKNWIETNYAQTINLQQLAKQCHLSTSQLQRRFKQVIGHGIAEYWRMTRLQKAKEFLLNQSLSIESISHTIGYENLPAFTRSFVRSFNISPSQWRKMMLAAKNMPLSGNI